MVVFVENFPPVVGYWSCLWFFVLKDIGLKPGWLLMIIISLQHGLGSSFSNKPQNDNSPA